MWELIEANKRKSFFLFVGMGLCLVAMGYGIGLLTETQEGGLFGILIALIVWAILSIVSFFSGDQILLATSGAKEVMREIHPQLFNIVEEMKIAAGLPAMPRIFIMDEAAPNAFACGRKPEQSAVCVTTGLLSRLNRDELQGVIAHEMSHVLNRDVLFMTFAGVMLGSIVLLSDVFMRGRLRASGSSRRYKSGSSSGGGQAQVVILIVAVLFIVLAPIMARLLYFAISRKREYLADASGARLTRYPEGLASALEKISDSGLTTNSANKVTAPMYISNPFGEERMSFTSLLSTHPPIPERVKILRSLTGNVSLAGYQKAYSAVTGNARLLPPSGLKDIEGVAIRKATVESVKKQEFKDRVREFGDLTRAFNEFAFLNCTCGLKIKVPPDFTKPKIICPRCMKTLENPFGAKPTSQEVLEYTRKTSSWESIPCACGKPVQISPLFSGTHVACGNCGRKIKVKAGTPV